MITLPVDDVTIVFNKDTCRDSGISIVTSTFVTCIGYFQDSPTYLEWLRYSEEPFPSLGAISSVTRHMKCLLRITGFWTLNIFRNYK
jgi:hypothetical protein